jgi:hypothetical protein
LVLGGVAPDLRIGSLGETGVEESHEASRTGWSA